MANGVTIPGIDLNALLAAYGEAKKKGTARLLNIEGSIYYVQRKFDSDSGEAKHMNVQIDAALLSAARDAIAKQLADLDALIADVGGAQKV